MKEYIRQTFKVMGGGGGGGNGGGGGGGEKCEEPHNKCPEPSNDSYCDLSKGHSGKHKCKACEERFQT